MCLEICKRHASCFIIAPALVWHAYLKNTTVKLDLLTDVDMLLMIEKGILGGMYATLHRYGKANNKYMKNYDRNEQ